MEIGQSVMVPRPLKLLKTPTLNVAILTIGVCLFKVMLQLLFLQPQPLYFQGQQLLELK